MTIHFNACHPSNYKSGRTSAIRYLVVHYTGNNGDTAAGNANYFAKNPNLEASAHYFVDESDDIWKSVPEGDTAWHCGTDGVYKHATCRNANSLGIELCSRKGADGSYYFKDKTVENAQTLLRALMAQYGIPIDHVLRHYDVTGKMCPAPFVYDDSKWRKFLEGLDDEDNMDVERFTALYDQMIAINQGDNPSDWAKSACQKAKDKGIFTGDGKGNYDWQEPLTREALAVTLDRLGLI